MKKRLKELREEVRKLKEENHNLRSAAQVMESKERNHKKEEEEWRANELVKLKEEAYHQVMAEMQQERDCLPSMPSTNLDNVCFDNIPTTSQEPCRLFCPGQEEFARQSKRGINPRDTIIEGEETPRPPKRHCPEMKTIGEYLKSSEADKDVPTPSPVDPQSLLFTDFDLSELFVAGSAQGEYSSPDS